MPIRVLIVDDSALVCRTLSRALSGFADIEIVGTAPDPFVARRLIVETTPDVVTLDIELPRMDGITFLRKLMLHHPLPVIVVSSFTPAGSARAVEALEAGALGVVNKPHDGFALRVMAAELVQTIRIAAAVDMARLRAARRIGLRPLLARAGRPARRLALIGASLGGTTALSSILAALPADAPGIVAALHMPGRYTSAFAQRLDSLSRMHVAEARHGDQPRAGLCLLAPGDAHTLVRARDGKPFIVIKDGPPVAGHRPCINVLFESAARSLGPDAVGVVLTGMGADGAAGLRAMHDAGAPTAAQDEETSVVFGMPAAAVKAGGVAHVASLSEMPSLIVRLATADRSHPAPPADSRPMV
jgi:two-component system, chemotaxis family, protein-glutamate methylesterase/glutaminase